MTNATVDLRARPELAFGPNPFFEAMNPHVEFDAWGRVLRNYPLEHHDWRQVPLPARTALLKFRSLHFAPVRTMFEPADGLQELIRRSCMMLNPTKVENQVRVNKLLVSETMPQMRIYSSLDGAGGIWQGMTGTMKSFTAKRVLEVCVPNPVVEYGPSQVCGWIKLTQIMYLYVDFPSNGTRGGLLKRILYQVDQLIGTDYSSDNARSVNIDSLLVAVCKVLISHRVLLLVIDENQEANFEDSQWKIQFVLFYLSLMNFGISILLLGNPLAFANLDAYSQVQRRFEVGGRHDYLPAASPKTVWWAKGLTPRMRQFSLVDDCDILPEEHDKIEFGHTSGLPGLVGLLQDASQRNCLRRKGAKAILTREDYEAGSRSPNFTRAKKLALAIQDGDVSEYIDIPALPEDDNAGGKATAKEDQKQETFIPNAHGIAAIKRLLRNYKAEVTRVGNKLTADLEILRQCSPDDLRMLGVTQKMLNEARKIEDQFSRDKGAKSRGQKAEEK